MLHAIGSRKHRFLLLGLTRWLGSRKGCGALGVDAELDNKIEQHGNLSNIGFWDNAGDSASWKVDFTKAGVYKVTAQCASLADGTAVALEVAGKQLVGKMKQTGDWGKFATVDFGTVEIVKTGVQEVKVRPHDANAWKPVNLGAVKFARGK